MLTNYVVFEFEKHHKDEQGRPQQVKVKVALTNVIGQVYIHTLFELMHCSDM